MPGPGPYDYSQGQWIDDGSGRGFLVPGGMYPQETPASSADPSAAPELPPQAANLGMMGGYGASDPALPPTAPPAPPPTEYAPPPAAAPAARPMTGAKTKPAAAAPPDKFAQADATVTGALNEQEQAGGEVADVQAQQADAKYQAQQAAFDDAQKIDAERQRVAAEREKMRTQKQEQVDRYVHDEDNFKIDEHKFWGDASTAKNIGRVIAMAMTGLGMALSGRGHEQNPVIAMFDQAARNSIQMQMDKRDALGKRTARAEKGLDAFDRITDAKDARFNADMARAYERGIRQGDLAASQYGSDLAKKNWKVQRGELEVKKGEYLGKAAEGAFGRDVQKQQLDLSRKQVAISGGQLALANKQFAWTKEKAEADMAIEVAKLNKAGDATKAAELQKFGVPGVKNADGTTFVATGSPEGVEKLRTKVSAANTLVSLMDEARRLRTGWTSETAKSKEWQELKANWAAAQGIAKDVLGLGALSGPDMELVNRFIGTDDPTQMRDPTAGIQKARGNVLKLVTNDLKAHGYEGSFDIADITSLSAPQLTPEQRDFKDTTTSERVINDKLPNWVKPSGVAGAASVGETQRAIRVIDSLASRKDAQGRAMLETLASDKTLSPEVRARAQSALDTVSRFDNATPEPEPGIRSK